MDEFRIARVRIWSEEKEEEKIRREAAVRERIRWENAEEKRRKEEMEAEEKKKEEEEEEELKTLLPGAPFNHRNCRKGRPGKGTVNWNAKAERAEMAKAKIAREEVLKGRVQKGKGKTKGKEKGKGKRKGKAGAEDEYEVKQFRELTSWGGGLLCRAFG